MKIDPSSLAFDIDDVFADTMALFLEIARNEHNLSELQREDITSYMVEECIDIDTKVLEDIFTKILDGSHTSSLRPVRGATEVLTRVGRALCQGKESCFLSQEVVSMAMAMKKQAIGKYFFMICPFPGEAGFDM